MVKAGRPRKEGKETHKRTTFYLPPEDMEDLKRLGKNEGLSASEYLHRTIRALVAKANTGS